MDLKNKKVLVIGSGISGIGAVDLLYKVGAKVTISDSNKELNAQEIKSRFAKTTDADNVDVLIGDIDDKKLDDFSICVVSPGIPMDIPLVQRLMERKIVIWGEVELAYRAGKGRVVAITGTNGKTTTTALTGAIMENYYKSTFVVGNIGTPYTTVALDTNDDSVVVAEISSFQLETIDKFKPAVSAVLNITPDHLNRHKTMTNYAAVKMSITKNQGKDDICVLNYEDSMLRMLARDVETNVIFFSSKTKLSKGAYLIGDEIMYNDGTTETLICKVNEMKLVGIHNVENVMAAIVMSVNMQVPFDIIRETIKNFNAVEHRIEYVTTKDGVIYYNDSKGTNTDASIKAIEAMSSPTILIAGGYDKGSEYDDWIKVFGRKIKMLVLLGKTKYKIAETAKKYNYTNIVMVESLEEAVKESAKNAVSGDAVLLSPACASWDMFKSYEERGKLFKEYVNQL